MIILGIETSCDETALALIETRTVDEQIECRVINSLVHSQAELHSAYGGVFPSLAKREHGKNLVPLLHKLLHEIDPDIDSNIDCGSNDIYALGRDRRRQRQVSTSVYGGETSSCRGGSDQMPLRAQLSDTEFNTILDTFKTDLNATNPDLFQSLLGATFLKNIPNIDHIAVTEGPGLEPALWVGINFARVLGTLWNIPVVPINHMEGHIVGSLLDFKVPYGTWQTLANAPTPAIALLISGGHTELVKIDHLIPDRALMSATVEPATSVDFDDAKQSQTKTLRRGEEGADLYHVNNARFTILGKTKDDAVGEAFDKVARLLGLPYPGGPHISMLAHEAYEKHIISPVKLPRPMLHSDELDFSFSGLKTAVLYAVRKAEADNKFDDNFKKGIAYEFEQAVTEVLDHKLRRAIDQIGAKSIIIGGGVSANHVLRAQFEKTANEYEIPIYLPAQHISGDNALMIALASALNETQNTMPTRTIHAQGTKSLDE